MTERQQEWLFKTPRMYFDTRNGINAMFRENPETALHEVSLLRQLYCELHKHDKLTEYVIDGEYLLERHGKTKHIEDPVPNKEACLKHGRAILGEDFLELTHIGAYHTKDVEYDPETLPFLK